MNAQIDFVNGLKSYHAMNNDYYNVTGNVAQNSNINTNYHELFYNAAFGNDSAAVTNNAGYFAGANRVNIFGKILNGDTDDFTIDFWFKSSTTTDQVFYWEGLTGNFRIYIRLEPGADRIRANIGNQGGGGSVHEVSTTQAYNDGFWHHYALTMSNGLTSKVFIDGVEVATNTQAYTLGATTNFTRLGCNDGITQFLNGYMDNLKVWDRTLSPAEIAVIYNTPKIVITSAPLTSCVNTSQTITYDVVGGTGNFESANKFYAQISDINGTFEYPVNIGNVSAVSSGTIDVTIPETISTGTYKIRLVATHYPMISENTVDINVTNANSFPGYDILSGLILHYKFDGNAEDFSGLGNDGTIAGSPTASTDQFGNTNGATHFNSPDRVDVGQPYPIRKYDNTTNAISFSFWLKQDFTPGDFGYIFSAWSPGSLDGLWIGTTNAGRVRFRINGGAFVEAVHTNGQWQHFVCVYNGANIRIYRDGVQIALAAVGGQVQIITGAEMGQNTQGGGAGQLNGHLDDFRIYKRALTGDEVITLYNHGLASNNGALCDGDDVELYGPNYFGLTCDWSGPNSFSSVDEDPTFTPFNAIANSGDYSMILTLNGCVGSPNFTELNSTVAPVASVVGDTICSGEMAVLSASGAADANHYVWYADALGTTVLEDSTASINLSAITTDTVYVNIKPNALCQSAVEPVIIFVHDLPNVVADASDVEICVGNEVILTGTGAQNYSWNNGVTDGLAFSPVATTTYTVTGIDANGCENTDDITIVVNPLPNVTANSTATTICSGEEIILTGGGASIYLWDNGATNGVGLSPTSSTIFTVVGTDVNGCENSDAILVTVNALPVTSFVSGNVLVQCDSESEIYSVALTTGSTYLWNVPAGATILSGQGTNSITVDFEGNFGIVSVVETNSNGCEGLPVELNVACNLSTTDFEALTIHVFPNPASENIYLNGIENLQEGIIFIRDAQGKIVFQISVADLNNQFISLQEFSPGFYYGTVETSTETFTFKFSKM